MNEHVRPPKLPPTTQAAEGLMRRRFTVAEIEAMVEAGIIPEHERIELIGGELVPMSPKGLRHESIKIALAKYWYKRLPDDLEFGQETTFRMNVDTFVEPDFVFWRTKDGLANLKPETALLAVEIADSSLGFDLGRKQLLYASFAIRELWVINARTLVTHVFSDPGREGYRATAKLGPKKRIEPPFSAELGLKLGELPLV